MISLDELGAEIKKWGVLVKDGAIKAQQETALQIQKDVKKLAPVRTGQYASSIKVSETVEHHGEFRTQIYTDLLVGGENPKWANIPLGCLLEWGTGIQGLHTNTYPHGYGYRLTPWCYYDEYLHMFVTTDGMIARPHFLPALDKNKSYYLKKIKEHIGK